MGQAMQNQLQVIGRLAPFVVPFAGAMMGCLTGMAFAKGHKAGGALCLAATAAMAYAAGCLLPMRADASQVDGQAMPARDSLVVKASPAHTQADAAATPDVVINVVAAAAAYAGQPGQPGNSVEQTAENTGRARLEDSGASTVYISKSGKKYHLSTCTVVKNPQPIPLDDALLRGLTPCRLCNPPALE